MNWKSILLAAGLATMPIIASADVHLAIGSLPKIESTAQADWAMSGYTIFKIRKTIGDTTPIMRTQILDARLVEILSRTESPRLSSSDIKVVRKNGRTCICIRDYFLTYITEADAEASGQTLPQLTEQWLQAARRALPQIAPV